MVSRPDEVDCTVNETLEVFVFTFYLFLRFISYTNWAFRHFMSRSVTNWSVINVVCYERDLLWTRPVMNVVYYECGLLWTWSVMNVVSFERGLLWTWSVLNWSVLKWSVMNVVWYELVCYERGLLWTWSVLNGSVMNVVCYECGLLWTWSVMNVVCYERGLLWVGLLRKGLLRTWYVLNGLSWVVCYELVYFERTPFLSPQICWLEKRRCMEKFWLSMKSVHSLILLLVKLVLSHCEFLVVFRQKRVWDRKSAEGAHVRMVCWACAGAGKISRTPAGAGWVYILRVREGVTRAGLHCENTAALDKFRAGQWCWNYVSLVNICSVLNTFQLKFQTLWRPLGFGDFRKKTPKRMWLCVGISPIRYALQTR